MVMSGMVMRPVVAVVILSPVLGVVMRLLARRWLLRR
jgi:hypothetical protein